jgi:hypothetical protein
MKLRNYEPRKAHKAVQQIQKYMKANERDYWWRLTHRVIQTKNRESKWKKDKKGDSMTRECPVCKAEENWDHYDYECRGVKEMNEKVAQSVGRKHAFSRNEWSQKKKEWRKK